MTEAEGMVERVARALQMYQTVHGPHYEGLARAAIAAMREPTEAMKEAYFGRMHALGFHSGMNASCAMQTMIDAALTETDGREE